MRNGGLASSGATHRATLFTESGENLMAGQAVDTSCLEEQEATLLKGGQTGGQLF